LAAAVAAAAAGLAAAPAEAGMTAGAGYALAALTPAPLPPLEEPLTPRELQVLRLLAKGLPNKQIARELTISEHTVKFHVSAIYAKFGAASRTEAVSHAARRGLVAL
ncbi:MAG: response regulator transcription factor, partial [Chloroflexota bacterium]